MPAHALGYYACRSDPQAAAEFLTFRPVFMSRIALQGKHQRDAVLVLVLVVQ